MMCSIEVLAASMVRISKPAFSWAKLNLLIFSDAKQKVRCEE